MTDKEMWIYTIVLLCTVFNGVFGFDYNMEHYCNGVISFEMKQVYQARLFLHDIYLYDKKSRYSPYERYGYCETTIEGWLTKFPKFMFYFENINLDCDDGHLELYSNSSSNAHVKGLSYKVCGKRSKPEGVFTVDSRYLRIKYVPKRNQFIDTIFTIIITSYGEGSCPSDGHVCDNGRCIDGDIACNDYDSCGDSSGCDLGTGSIVGIVIGSIVFVGLVISIVVCCIRCRRRSKGTTGIVQSTATTTPPMTSQPMYGMNQPSHAYPVSVGNPNIHQQDNIQITYVFNQGTNQEPSVSNPQTNGQVEPSTPPPPYDEII